MRTLQTAIRVSDRSAAAAFYTAVGYEVIGEAPDTPLGHLTMLKLPGDEFVSLELVHDPKHPPTVETTLSHIALQVDSLSDTVDRLAAAGIVAEPIGSPGPDMYTTTIVDPDGRRIELVQWPPGHPDGLTAADWDQKEDE
jgi:lactoylglutathione lyase